MYRLLLFTACLASALSSPVPEAWPMPLSLENAFVVPETFPNVVVDPYQAQEEIERSDVDNLTGFEQEVAVKPLYRSRRSPKPFFLCGLFGIGCHGDNFNGGWNRRQSNSGYGNYRSAIGAEEYTYNDGSPAIVPFGTPNPGGFYFGGNPPSRFFDSSSAFP